MELLSYTGDHLSYFQDAVSNEAFLDTVRQRVSAKRHARLIDYDMHDGRNAWTYVHFEAASTGQVPLGTQILSRVGDPLRNTTVPPSTVIHEVDLPEDAFDADPALRRCRVFETTFALDVYPENNTIYLHAWGNRQCCLPGGATSAYVYALDPANPDRVIRPTLQAGDFLIVQEVLGPETGNPADADPEHRQAVQLTAVSDAQDTVYQQMLSSGALQVRGTGDPPLPLLEITWRNEDALGFPVCLSAATRGGALLRDITLVRGNIVLADHGRTRVETHALPEPVPADAPFRLDLNEGPVTLQCQPDTMDYSLDPVTGASPQTARRDLMGDASRAQPAVVLMARFPTGDQLWTPVPHLLDSPPFAAHFVVDVDNNGGGELRFGDGQYGREPAGARAAFRWTGSWYTVVLAIDPRRPEDLITEPGGRTRLEPTFRDRVQAHITRYRLAGYDLEIRSGQYVPIEIDLLVCVKPDYFAGDVLQAVSAALSSGVNPDGSKGFFHPDFFTFGQPVYLSRLYAAVEAVEGVDSAVVTRFRVYGEEDNGELEAGLIPMGDWQIARLDNDPNFQENGVLRLSAGAGK
ncbi:MAG: hypothetical protein JSW39_26930 [Desulfobacterales bacterium]|nr:MAG: hypothetical protein JSW39_26930 [Desulfobacterales bacterium]